MITFDDLVLNGYLVFDDLDTSAIGSYTQQANPSLVLSGGGSQGYLGIYDQELDVELVFEFATTQEFLAPTAAQAYLQSTNVQTILYGGSAQEHIAIAAGEWGQSGTVIFVAVLLSTQEYYDAVIQTADVYLTVELGSYQEYYGAGGTVAGEQDANVVLIYDGIALQDWEDQFSGPQAYSSRQSVVGIVDGYTSFPMLLDPNGVAPSYFYLKFVSADNGWLNNEGLGGEPVAVEISYTRPGENIKIPLASVTPDRDTLLIYPYANPAFNHLYDMLAVGEFNFYARGFERFADYSLNQRFEGDALLRIRAYYDA